MTNSKRRSTAGRLFEYALLYKGRIAVAIVILTVALFAQLAGPLIAKNIIDNHILAINFDWFEMRQADVPAGTRFVAHEDRAYVRSDWIQGQTPPESATQATIEQSGTAFVLHSGQYGDSTLTADEVTNFYRHDIAPVMRLIGLIVGLALAASVLNFIQGYMLQAAAQRIVQKMRMDVFRHIHRIPIRYFDNTPVGQVVSRVANDTENIKELYMSFMSTFAVSGMNIVGVFVALIVLDYRLALVCLTLIPIYVLIIIVHLKFSKKFVTIIRARLADMNAMLNEVITVMPIIQAFRREKALTNEFEQLNEDRYRNQLMQFRIFAFSGRNAVYFVGRLFTAIVVWYFGSQSLESAISFGVFYAFIDYLSRIYEPIIGIFDQLMNAQRAVVSAERVFSLLDKDGIPVDSPRDVPRRKGFVTFDNVTFGYKEGEPVLTNISFEAGRGETIALVGHTGSGKSSIMNLLLGFYEQTKGSIRIDDVDISKMSKQELRKHMGIVLQDPFLFTGDIKFNVSLYSDLIEEERVKQALKEVGADFIDQLPSGLNEPVLERGSTLSAGQRQLISFARALAYDPAILILDEATSSIDSETERTIQDALHVLREGRTTFIIAHRLSTIKDADTILVLHRGNIVERGNHEQLMAMQGRYYRMYQLQLSEAGAAV